MVERCAPETRLPHAQRCFNARRHHHRDGAAERISTTTTVMAAVAVPPQKRVLAESTKAHSNANILASPAAAKRRKLDAGPSAAVGRVPGSNGLRSLPNSSQPKSQFEEEVLEKLTQDLSELKEKNAEKDQQWERPPLHDFNETRDKLLMQQIDAERGNLLGGKPTIKLFGVTDVSAVAECPDIL